MYLTQIIKQWDESLFLYLNNLPHNFYFDQFFLFFSFYPWITWVVIALLIIIFEERKEKLFILKLLLAIFLSGILCSGILKPVIKRPRPDIAYGERVVIVQEKPALVFWNNNFAFPSGHAAVAFAGAYILIAENNRYTKKKSKRKLWLNWIFFGFAALTAYSRIYLGKHYPVDVILGGFLGWLMGWVAWKIIDIFEPKHVY